jgi:hypothetical protein
MIAGIAMLSSGTSWLASAMTPDVPMMAVSARMTGTEAATSAPKVSARMSSVKPNDRNCELPSSALVLSSISFWKLASPYCSIAIPE